MHFPAYVQFWQCVPGASASAAADYVDVGTALEAFKHTGNQDFFFKQDSAANGAAPFFAAVDAVHAAANVHQAVAPPGN